jgi:hypothetical protein
MYFPKSQIKTNLYTKGNELYYENNNKEYIGYYFKASNGEYYTGKSPNDLPNTKLIFQPSINQEGFQTQTSQNELPNTPIGLISKKENKWSENYIKVYNTSPLPTPPTQFYPQPTQEDYSIGEFQRYFVKRTNEPKFIEINKTQYDKYLSKDPQVAYQLYIPFFIPWEISGDRNNVFNTNKNTVERIEKRQQLWGLKSYFKDRYTQFYK